MLVTRHLVQSVSVFTLLATTMCTTSTVGSGGGDPYSQTSESGASSSGTSNTSYGTSSTSSSGNSTSSGSSSSTSRSGNSRGSSSSGKSTSSSSGATSSSSSSSPGAGIGNCPVFLPDSPWNTDISNAPVDSRSSAYIASIGLTTPIHGDFGTVYGIPYNTVLSTVPPTKFTFDTASESDPGPYLIPANPVVEGGSDAHLLSITTDTCVLYETWSTSHPTTGWHAGSGAIWDLKIDSTRPAGWTSADAAGLPVFPGLARYDEAAKGEIKHALRFTTPSTQKAYVAPASHFASSDTNPNLPPFGLRVRLKASVNTSGYPAEIQVILTALKKYGMFLADIGSAWYISGAPDSRWSDDNIQLLGQLHGSDFEAVQTGTLVTK